MLSWDRLDLGQVCWKVLDVMPSFGCSQLFQRVSPPASILGKGQSSSLWVLRASEESSRGPEISAKISAAFAHKRLLRSLPKAQSGIQSMHGKTAGKPAMKLGAEAKIYCKFHAAPVLYIPKHISLMGTSSQKVSCPLGGVLCFE